MTASQFTGAAKQPARKYPFDVSLSFSSEWSFRLTAAELHRNKTPDPEAEPMLRRCHVYAVCRQPVLSIDPSTFVVFGGKATGHLLRHQGGSVERHAFSFNVEPATSKGLRVAPFPHRSLISDTDRHWPIMLLGKHLGDRDASFLKMEVLYIGQAYGNEGSRDAMQRLRSHSTLQKILALGAEDSPDQEISIVGFAFHPPSIMTITDGRSPVEGEAWEHVRNVMDNPLSQEEQIDLIEAGLIRYFQPLYNEHFREKFPDAGQKLLQGLYRTDIAGLVVEIDTSAIYARLWSPTRGDGTHHVAVYDLHDPSVRQSFFTLTGPNGKILPSVESGPRF